MPFNTKIDFSWGHSEIRVGIPELPQWLVFGKWKKVVSSLKLAQLCNEDPEKANLSVGMQERGLGNPALHRTTPCDAYFEL